MKIAWIYPHRNRCGIALYAERYCEALNKRVEILPLDPANIFCKLSDLIVQVNRCDLVHIQYETSFFMSGNADWYKRLLESIKPPVIVTLHEVYRTFPDVYSREEIRGSFISLPLKRLLYDYKHPVQTAYRRHVRHSFFAKVILVHQKYHKKILEDQRVSGHIISVLPHPVNIVPDAQGFLPWDPGRPAHLVGSGFINPHYEYDLLFASLKKLPIPWRFTWIGGVRRDEDKALLNKILAGVRDNNWQERFQVTGWMPNEEHDKILYTADVVCALFSARSSSGSIASAIGAMRPIVAAALPLTEELAANHGVVRLVQASAESVAKGIEEVLENGSLRVSLEMKVREYREKYNYEVMADELIEVYKKCL
jgi:glycosyltransferase involved in cell wall biosynthesis